jgi:hypothetical protein
MTSAMQARWSSHNKKHFLELFFQFKEVFFIVWRLRRIAASETCLQFGGWFTKLHAGFRY